MDADGQSWPNYNYIRGRTIDARGMEKVVACPLPDAEKDFSNALALFWTEGSASSLI